MRGTRSIVYSCEFSQPSLIIYMYVHYKIGVYVGKLQSILASREI